MTDPPAPDRWRAKQSHYQDPRVAREYDSSRFTGPHSSGDTERFWRALERALGPHLESVTGVLDVPCGTARFAPFVARDGRALVLADLSQSMLDETRDRPEPRIRADAFALPFADASFDLVLCMRFLFHVPRELQPRALSELARVSRRFVAVDIRHAWAWSAWSRALRGKLFSRPVSWRIPPREIDAWFAQSGLRVRSKHWFAPGFSEKVLVLAETQRSAS